jgi:drug/metabolite transporter (DMT)-like permease
MFEERTIDLNQISQTSNRIWLGPLYMILAGVVFAVINAISYKVTAPTEWGGLGFDAKADVFWQYAIALAFSLPFLWRSGALAFSTRQPIPHIIRVVLSSAGLVAFTSAFQAGVPVWQVVALTMTAPFFVLIGAKLFLGETVTLNRWIASIAGFAGALIVTNPLSAQFTVYWLLPVLAAVLWGGASLFTKYLSRTEAPETLTTWLLLLLTPINLLFSLQAGFQIPTGNVLWLIVVGGFLVFVAQLMLSKSYASSEANLVQPFDDLKLISNVLVYGLVFGYWPEGYIWLGLAMIMAASIFLITQESRKRDMDFKTA